ncbi:unnamed protein product [Candida verbasci]|uniref:Calponin-homology (CH) domain-containing protein n=1 Tax=Candida verbasci TaxID=1227364 RepID=A0A9W4TTA7_9ASCO|nr:unnamed protein product [Candida verbasci]
MSSTSTIKQEEVFFVNWINIKLLEDSLINATPTSTEKPVLINNLTSDLQHGLILIKLINKIIYDITLSNPSNEFGFYYLTPINKNPTLKLQKFENLIDFLKFLKIILQINIIDLNAEDIYDGNLKSILNLIWNLWLFHIKSVPQIKDYADLKSNLLEWLNGRTNLDLRNFTNDWIMPERILTKLVNSYYRTRDRSLSDLIEFIESTFAIPQLIQPQDFNNEKCLIVYLFELYKVFVVEESYKDLIVDQTFKDVVDSIIYIYDLKIKYEIKANKLLNELQNLIIQLEAEEDNLEIYRDFKLKAKPVLLYKSYPSLIHIHGIINSTLDNFGMFKFKPSIDINDISIKLNEVMNIDLKLDEKYKLEEEELHLDEDEEEEPIDLQVSPNDYTIFKLKLIESTDDSFLSDVIDKDQLQQFFKLLPSYNNHEVSVPSPNESTFDLISTSSSSEDDTNHNIFDESTIITTTRYNYVQFFERLENGLI